MNESAAWEKVSVVYFPTTENIYQDAFSHAAAFLGSDVLMDVKAQEKKVTYYRQMKHYDKHAIHIGSNSRHRNGLSL